MSVFEMSHQGISVYCKFTFPSFYYCKAAELWVLELEKRRSFCRDLNSVSKKYSIMRKMTLEHFWPISDAQGHHLNLPLCCPMERCWIYINVRTWINIMVEWPENRGWILKVWREVVIGNLVVGFQWERWKDERNGRKLKCRWRPAVDGDLHIS